MRTSDQVERDAAVRFLAIAQDTLYVRQGTLNTVRALILGWLESQPDDRLGLMLLKVIDAARAGGPAYCSGTEERMTEAQQWQTAFERSQLDVASLKAELESTRAELERVKRWYRNVSEDRDVLRNVLDRTAQHAEYLYRALKKIAAEPHVEVGGMGSSVLRRIAREALAEYSTSEPRA